MKFLIPIYLVIILLFIPSCSTDPSGADLTPSTLSVSFTGQTDNSGSGESSGPADLETPFFSEHNTTGPKSNCVVTAIWDICSNMGFNSYLLYRSESPNISSDPSSAELLGEFTTVNTSIYVDSDVIWGTKYYYALKTADSEGIGVWSNEPSITTPEMDPPTPSVLTVADVSWYYADFEWSKCPESNFESYRLYRSETPGIESDSTLADLVCDLDWSLDTLYTDQNVNYSTTYYYALLTSNTENMSSWSDEISLTTMSNIPDSIVATIDVGDDPWDIISLPSGDYVYVTNRGNDNVSVIRSSDNTVVSTVTVGDNPYGICSLPSGEYLYVANWGSDNVSVIRTSDNSVVSTIAVGNRPVGICALPSGDYVYVTNRDDDNVSVIRTSDNTVVASVDVGSTPYQICSIPSGDYVYLTNWSSNSVSVIRTSDNTVVTDITMYTNPIGINSIQSGDYVYVSNFGTDVVAVIRTSDNTVLETVDVGNGPWGISTHPSGECIFVANSIENTLSFIRTMDNTVLTTRVVGNNPSSICSLPSGDALYVVNFNDGNVSVLQ